MNNVRLELRLLAHSIDAATVGVPIRRKRKQRPSAATSLALLLAASALLVFAMGAIR